MIKAAHGFAARHWLSLALAIAIGFMIMAPYRLERLFCYFPSARVDRTPSSIGLRYQDLQLKTEDDVKVHGWFVPAPGAGATILILHGNAGNVSHRLDWIAMLQRLPANVLIIDYRGYGLSEGTPFEEGLYRDARAAYRWWETERRPEERLVVLGESLGGAVAVDLASRVPVAGLVLQSTFTTAWDMAKTMLPIGLLQPLTSVRFDSGSKIGRIHCPKLFIHGTRDDIVPLRLGRELYDLAAHPKQFYEVSGAGHNDLVWRAGPDYLNRLRQLIESLPD